jgi:hypothetical protein
MVEDTPTTIKDIELNIQSKKVAQLVEVDQK